MRVHRYSGYRSGSDIDIVSGMMKMTGRAVTGWVLFVLGIIAIVVLLLMLASLLLGSTCLVLVEKEYPGTVEWGQIAVPFIGTLFGLVLSGLAVWGGWRLAHPRRRARLVKPQPSDEHEDVSE